MMRIIFLAQIVPYLQYYWSSIMITKICKECSKPFKVNHEVEDFTCSECLKLKTLNLQNQSRRETSIKVNHKVRFENDEQILSALESVGDAFRSTSGGANLMLTEHVENGIDAIEDFVKVNNLHKYEGRITIRIDSQREELIIIDNGSGIIDPVWIIENPLKSRKTGESHQKGEFGRGLQGFRGFCNKLTYITLRQNPSETELNHTDHINAVRLAKEKGIGIKCVRLTLKKNEIITTWEPVQCSEFKKYSESMTGTVAIFSEWLPGEFDDLTKDKQKIYERIQHHFKVPLEKSVTKIYFAIDKKSEEIVPRKYEVKNKDGVMEDLVPYKIPDRPIINPYTKQLIGTLQIRFYQASPNYEHTYKAPYLLVGDRPLGNSILHKMDVFKDKLILKSPFLTGYVVANFLKPDSLRLAPKPGEDYKQFVIHLKDIIDHELTPQLEKYREAMTLVDKNYENQKLILQVQSFLRNLKNVKFDLIQANRIGKLSPSDVMGEEKDQRLSDIPNGDNQGIMTKDGSSEKEIMYKKIRRGPYIDQIEVNGEDIDSDKKKVTRIRVKFPTEDGRSTTDVLINPSLSSKDGRIKKQNLTGPQLENCAQEYNRHLSIWDESKFTVLINEENATFKEYEEIEKIQLNMQVIRIH